MTKKAFQWKCILKKIDILFNFTRYLDLDLDLYNPSKFIILYCNHAQTK